MKILIIVLFCVALLLMFIKPSFVEDAIESCKEYGMGKFWSYVVAFYCISAAFLCWLGVAVGWRFGLENGFEEVGRIVLAFLGIFLAPFIALYKLFSMEN